MCVCDVSAANHLISCKKSTCCTRKRTLSEAGLHSMLSSSILRFIVIGDRYPIGSPYVVTILCAVNDAPLLPLSFDRFPPNFPSTRVQVVARDTWFHIPEKVSMKGSNFRKNRLFWGTLRYPVCAQLMGHGVMFCDAYTLSIP